MVKPTMYSSIETSQLKSLANSEIHPCYHEHKTINTYFLTFNTDTQIHQNALEDVQTNKKSLLLNTYKNLASDSTFPPPT